MEVFLTNQPSAWCLKWSKTFTGTDRPYNSVMAKMIMNSRLCSHQKKQPKKKHLSIKDSFMFSLFFFFLLLFVPFVPNRNTDKKTRRNIHKSPQLQYVNREILHELQNDTIHVWHQSKIVDWDDWDMTHEIRLITKWYEKTGIYDYLWVRRMALKDITA